MADETVDFERVTKVYREESSKKTLSRLEPDFYEKLGAYVRGLEVRAVEEVAKAPNSPKAMLVQDELRKAVKKREQILQYRGRKIALLAASKATGGEADTAGLAKPEMELFAKLVHALATTRAVALGEPPPAGSPAPDASPPPPAATTSIPPPPPAAPAPAFQRLSEPPRKIPPPAPKDLVVVHVLEDIPSFAGIDGKYTLHKEDVVTLPRAIARVLIDRGKVRAVQTVQTAGS